MYPYHWTWTYTLIAIGVLLSLFALCCAVLLLRRSSHGAMHRTPESMPDGSLGYRQVNLHVQLQTGTDRARERETYHMKGKE